MDPEVPPPSLHWLTANSDVAGLEALYAQVGKKGGIEELDSNLRDWRGQSPLDVAAIWNAHPAVKLLVEKGEADTNAQNAAGLTALHRAALWGHLECAKELLEAGAPTKTKTKNSKFRNGETAEVLARRYNMTEVADLILNVEKERKAAEEAENQEDAKDKKAPRGSKARGSKSK